MEQLVIEIEGRKKVFLPGDMLRGRIRWSCAETPKTAELRLFWYTRGKGTAHSELVEGLRYDRAGPSESHNFDFKLPLAPYSFSGKLITLTWALELDIEGCSDPAVEEFVVSPFGKEVQLNASL
ncbi:MAG TPA: hypothetical protein PLP17_00470 [Oligoflexia bacterium]|nr:hypothetical protein [Oligoflexia bacterium]